MLQRLPLFLAAGLGLASPTNAQTPATLDSIARIAVDRNLALRRAAERAREADAGVRQAIGLFIPAVNLESRYTSVNGVINIGDFINPAYAALNQLTGTSAFPTNIDASLPMKQETRLRSSVPLFNGALLANLTAARAIRGLRDAESGAERRRVDAAARLAWLNWARAARAVEVWDATLPVLVENARVSQCLVDAGSATPDAVLRARASLADAQQQRADAVRLREAARGSLNLLLDQPDDTPIPAPTDVSIPPVPSLTLDEALALSKRREERAMARAAFNGAKAQGRAVASAFLPSLALAADYGVQGDKYQFDRQHDVATASIIVQWNVFNGGQDGARRRAAAAAQRAASLQQAEVERQITLDVRTAWDALQVARESMAAADARLAASTSAFTLVDRRYVEGLASYLEWSDARAQLTAAQLNQVLTQYTLQARGVELERAAAIRSFPTN